MRSSTRATVLSVTVGALLLTGSPAHAQGVWTVVPSPNEPGRNFLLGADASDASHVWAVGHHIGRGGAAGRSLVLRHDGTAWRPAPVSGFPAASGLSEVDAVTSTDAWAVGTASPQSGRASTFVARWNGTTWRPEPTPNVGDYNNLSGVAAAGGTVFAVGTYVQPGSSIVRRALILQRTAGVWRIAPTPKLALYEFLEAVDATGPTDAWAVGWASNDVYGGPGIPTALRWNGSAWRSVPMPNPGRTSLHAVEAISPTNVWAVGQTNTGSGFWQPYVAHFNGTSWRRMPTPTIETDGALSDIVALSPSNIIAVGTAGGNGPLVLHWNGVSWAREAAPGRILTGAAAVSPNTFWAVGYSVDLSVYEERTFTAVRR